MKTLNPKTGLAGEYLGSALVHDLVGDAAVDLRLTRLGQLAYLRDRETGEEEYQAHLDALGTSVARDGPAWYPEWDFSNGGECGALIEHGKDSVRFGSHGRLVEPSAATNNVRGARCEDAEAGVVGSGGALPIGWQVLAAAGLTTTVIGSGYRDGCPRVRLALSGTISGTYVLGLEASDQIVASNGQTRTTQVGIALVKGSGLQTALAAMYERTAAGAAVTDGAALPKTIRTTHRRLFCTRTLSGGGTVARVIPAIKITGSGTINATVDILLPDEKLGELSSPVLPPIGEPVVSTRPAETLTSLVTVARASRGSDAGVWDFLHGTEAGPLTEFAPNVARITSKGILVEPTGSNLYPDPRFELGYNFLQGQNDLLASTEEGEEDGWSYIELHFQKTGASSGACTVFLQEVTGLTGGQSYTIWSGLRLVSGDKSQFTDIRLLGGNDTQDGTFVRSNNGDNLYSLLDRRRLLFRRTFTLAAPANRMLPAFRITPVAGDIDVKIRIYHYQFEAGIYPTSPIRPPEGTTGVSTRVGDVVQVDLDTANASGGPVSFYCEYVAPDPGPNYGAFVNIHDGSDRLTMGKNVAGSLQNSVSASLGGAGIEYTYVNVTQGTAMRVVAAFDQDDAIYGYAGEDLQTDTAGVDLTVLGSRTLNIGSNHANGAQPGTYISRVQVWDRRLTDAEANAKVGN